MNADRDFQFGLAALAQGLISEDVLYRALAELAVERSRGVQATLEEHLVARGVLTPDRVASPRSPEDSRKTIPLPAPSPLDPTQVLPAGPPPAPAGVPTPDQTLADAVERRFGVRADVELGAVGAVSPPTPRPEVGAAAWHAEAGGEGGTPRPAGAVGVNRPSHRDVPFGARYAVEGEIARGGMGIVLDARDREIRREVAIKVMIAGDKADPDQVARFVEEAQVQGQLEHPNICPVHEIGMDAKGRLYFTMKKVKGRSLAEILSEMREGNPQSQRNQKSQASDGEGEAPAEPPTLPHLLEIFAKVCDAVAFAHSKGVIHRDLKPENVMVGEFGEVLVMDWGLAKIAGRTDRNEKALVISDRQEGSALRSLDGTVMGTPAYMPPEQANGEVKDIDERSDVYALGGILYSILTLRPPYEGRDVREVLEKVKRHELETPSRRVRGGNPKEIPNPKSQASDPGGSGVPAATSGGRGHPSTSLGARKAPPTPKGRGAGLPAVAPEERRRVPARTGGSALPGATSGSRAQKGPPTRAVPPDLEAACLKAMSARKEDRYATVQALKADVTAFLEGRTLAAARYTFAQLAKLWVKRNKVFAATAGAAAAILLAATVFYVVSVTRARGEAEQNATRARAAELQAKRQETLAKEQETEAKRQAEAAELRFAEGLVTQGDAFILAGRWAEARSRYLDARGIFTRLHRSTLSADLGLWDLTRQSPLPLQTLTMPHSDWICIFAFGRLVLSWSEDKTLRLWEVETGREVRTFTGRFGGVDSVAISPDGRLALSWSGDEPLKLWDVETGRQVRTFTGHSGGVDSVAISPDGHLALSWSGDEPLKLWDVETGREVRTFTGHSAGVDGVAISPDGRLALSWSGDEPLKLWDAETGREVRTFTGHTARVSVVTFSPDGRLALSGSFDRTLKLWEVETGREVRTFTGHSSWVNSVAFSPDGRLALSGSHDKTLKLWDVETGREVRTFTGYSCGVDYVAFFHDGWLALSQSYDKTLKLWKVETSREVRTFSGHSDYVSSVAFSPDGRLALSGSADKTLKLWDVETGREVRTFTGHSAGVYGVALSPDGRLALSGSVDNTLKLWDVKTGREVRTFTGHSGCVSSVAFSPDGRLALSGSEDNTLKLWEVETGREVRTFTGHSSWVNSVAFSPDGRLALSGSHDKTLKLWDVETGREVRTCTGHSSNVNMEGPIFYSNVARVAFSPDGRLMLSWSEDNTLKLWEVETGREVRTFTGHSHAVSSVAFSPDGRLALSGSFDNTLKIWEVETGREVRTFTGHSQGVSSVAFSPDGRLALSGSHDKTLKLWDFSSTARYPEFEPRLVKARESIQKNPDDPEALKTYGDWYAFRGVWDWAVEFLEKARAGGAKISSLELARCYWQKAWDPAINRRGGTPLARRSSDLSAEASGKVEGAKAAVPPADSRPPAGGTGLRLAEAAEASAAQAGVPPLQPAAGVGATSRSRPPASGADLSRRSSEGAKAEAPPTPVIPNHNDLAAARREFARALAEEALRSGGKERIENPALAQGPEDARSHRASSGEAPEFYLKLCIQALDREMSPPEPPPAQSATASLVVKGAQEGERLSVIEHTGAAIVEIQPVGKYFGLGRWSGDAHLWWHGGGKPGDLLKLQFSSDRAGPHAIVLALTRAPDYGIFKASVNGKVVAEAIDLYQPDGVGVEAMTFENVELKAGENELLFEIVGTNPKAKDWAAGGLYMMGLDYVLVK